jgi:hypothetical protein
MDGFELTLRRFPGLEIDRRIPCSCQNGGVCSHEFSYEQLLKRLERKPPKFNVECPESFEDVDVRFLLFGLVPGTLDEVHRAVQKSAEESAERHTELLALLQREFAKSFRREQSKIESHCPNIFVLRPMDSSTWKKALFGEKTQLQLYCQAPGYWHPTQEGGQYLIGSPAKWLRRIRPYVQKMVQTFKFVSPLVGPWIGMTASEYENMISQDIKFMQELVKMMPDIEEARGMELTDVLDETTEPERAHGAALRAVRQLLDEKDPQRNWGGLQKVLTPEGHYLWLCGWHAEEYADS